MTNDHEHREYLLSEWSMFAKDPRRSAEALKIVRERTLRRILDVGCGAGQEMIPFVIGESGQAGKIFGVGIDLSPEAGLLGRSLFETASPEAKIEFSRATAEQLPFSSDVFDVVICRLALPYTNNSKALSEMSRVLSPQGVLMLKIHHLRYYFSKLFRAAKRGDLPSMLHSVRVILGGAVYHASGKQPRNFLTAKGESFQTRGFLERELAKYGLTVLRELADTSPRAPSLLIQKSAR